MTWAVMYVKLELYDMFSSRFTRVLSFVGPCDVGKQPGNAQVVREKQLLVVVFCSKFYEKISYLNFPANYR